MRMNNWLLWWRATNWETMLVSHSIAASLYASVTSWQCGNFWIDVQRSCIRFVMIWSRGWYRLFRTMYGLTAAIWRAFLVVSTCGAVACESKRSVHPAPIDCKNCYVRHRPLADWNTMCAKNAAAASDAWRLRLQDECVIRFAAIGGEWIRRGSTSRYSTLDFTVADVAAEKWMHTVITTIWWQNENNLLIDGLQISLKPIQKEVRATNWHLIENSMRAVKYIC